MMNRAQVRRGAWARGSMLAALLAYWLIELRHLAAVPRAYEDEAWIASTSWKLVTQGVFATDIQGNYFGMAQHYFGFMPLYPLLQAFVFRVAGLGLWQARLTSVLLGLLVLALTYALGRRLFGAPVGLLAVAGLLLGHTAGLTPYRPSGILLIDLARLARYDIAVPVFGLAACLAVGRARPLSGRRAGWWAGLAGAFGALAGLAHVYGWFWLPVLAAALLHIGARRRAGRWAALSLGALTLGAGLVLAPYGVYVLTHWSDWYGQTADYEARARLSDAAWYAANLVTEVQRYGPGIDWADGRAWLRPGLWLALVSGPVGGVALVRRAGRSVQAAALAWGLVLLPALMALLISSKVANYLLLFLPLAALAAAWGLAQVWRAARARRRRWLQALVVVGCAAAALEGLGHWSRLDAAAATTTPYDQYLAEVRAAVDAAAPESAPTVLGLHTYWLGYSDLPFTSWVYPLAQARTLVPGAAVPVTVTLERLAPDIVLIDARVGLFLSTPETGRSEAALINAWLAAEYEWVAGVDDATYGRTDVYRRRPGSRP